MEYLYAAYGSNTDVQQFKCRCPQSQLVGRGIIEGYMLTFQGQTGSAYCNILKVNSKDKKPCTPVAIWRITDSDLSRLDRYEGYPTVYNRVEIPVKVSEMEFIKCIVYVMTEGKEVPYNVPSLDYLYTVMRGYKINAIAEYKTLTKELLLFYLAANDFDTYSVWICRYNKDEQLIETKRFTAEQEEQMLEYMCSKGVSKEAFLRLYDKRIMPYFRTEEFLRLNPRICREVLGSDVNTLTFMDGSTVTECPACVIG